MFHKRRASQVAQWVKNPPEMKEIWDPISIPGLGRYPKESMAIYPSILAKRIPMDGGAWQATVQCHKMSDMTEMT